MVEEDPLTKQTVLNTVAKGGRNMMTPMPGGLAKQSNMVATVLNRKKGEPGVSLHLPHANVSERSLTA